MRLARSDLSNKIKQMPHKICQKWTMGLDFILDNSKTQNLVYNTVFSIFIHILKKLIS